MSIADQVFLKDKLGLAGILIVLLTEVTPTWIVADTNLQT